jgi:hypothetical protein
MMRAMTPTVYLVLPLLLTVGLAVEAGARLLPRADNVPLAHMVFFTLKDHSQAARDAFIASCQKNLTNHEGVTYFSVGTYADDVEEAGVSVKDFDIALHVVFENKAAKAHYLEHPRHDRFVEENKASFEKVRVFDSYLAKP